MTGVAFPYLPLPSTTFLTLMATRDPRIDAYIAKSAEFARPILGHLRDVVHAACPEVEETMKWSMPHFDYKGSMMCSMASFKEHCAFGFWKGSILFEDGAKSEEAMGQFGRIRSVKDLPSKKEITALIKRAMKLNDEGVKPATRTKTVQRAEIPMPEELARALRANKGAKKQFDAFPPGKQREYVEWIADAKTDATRAKRVEQAVEWISEGKARHWKYERK
jgi:uncharacterized protein YdeI (YjbR/CyaY-like superfamily)